MPHTLQSLGSSWQGLTLSLRDWHSDDGISTRAGELESLLREFGGSAPVVVLLCQIDRAISYIGGPEAFLLDAVLEEPDLFEWAAT